MSLRRSRRLRGLATEEQVIDQVCFICQLRIHVNHLSRCVSTPCCSVFMHRSCHNSMVERLPTCSNCRRPNVDHVPGGVILETDEELDVNDDDDEEEREGIAELRNMLLWNFVDLFSDRIMYVHGVVELPIEPTLKVRVAVYRLFYYNTPYEAFDVLASIRFRLFFPEEWTYGCRDSTVDFATLSRRPFIVSKWLRVYMTFYFLNFFSRTWSISIWLWMVIFVLNRFHTTSLSQLPLKYGWERIAKIPGYWPSFWDSQLDDSFMGTVTLPHLSSYVVHFLPCDERLCGTILWVIWLNQIDVHSRNCVFSNQRYTVSACTKMRVWHVFFSIYPTRWLALTLEWDSGFVSRALRGWEIECPLITFHVERNSVHPSPGSSWGSVLTMKADGSSSGNVLGNRSQGTVP